MIVRGIVGFVTMLLMFELRGGKDGLDVSTEGAALGGATATVRDIDITGDPRAPVWHFGIVGLFAVLGTLGGVRFAPTLRRRLTEETNPAWGDYCACGWSEFCCAVWGPVRHGHLCVHGHGCGWYRKACF